MKAEQSWRYSNSECFFSDDTGCLYNDDWRAQNKINMKGIKLHPNLMITTVLLTSILVGFVLGTTCPAGVQVAEYDWTKLVPPYVAPGSMESIQLVFYIKRRA